MTELGEREVDADINCTVTRMSMRSPLHVLATRREYKRLLREIPNADALGLLRAAFLVEDSTTCHSFSVWNGRPSMSADVPAHVDVVRRAFSRLEYERGRGPELWSTRWRLVGVSNNLNWGDFDLRSLIGVTRA